MISPIVLFENPHLLIVDKPAGMIVHASRHDPDTLLECVRSDLERRGSPPPFLTPSNRLDRNTRGPVIFAKNPSTASDLITLFKQGRIEKTYRARLIGSLPGPLFIEAHIERGSHRRVRVSIIRISTECPAKSAWFEANHASPTISATLIRPIECRDEKTIVEIDLWTGRHHQIRAVCEAIGHPILGDRRYNRVKGLKRLKNSREGFSIHDLTCITLRIPDWGIEVHAV